MFVEIRKLKNKKKYYLAHSYREEGKVKKIVRYLGKNLSEKQVKKLRKGAEKHIIKRIEEESRISDPLNTVLSTVEFKELLRLEKKIHLEVSHFNKRDWESFAKSFSYDTNAIEGSTITQGEVSDILERNEWPKERSTWEIAETYGVKDAIDFIKKAKEHFSINLIKELHWIVFKNSKVFAGKLRPRGVEVAVTDRFGKIVHRGEKAAKVVYRLKELIGWYQKNKTKYSGLVLAVVVHNQFETIHPFQDGNGRVGRLLLNNVLIKHGLAPVNIRFESRQKYYKALREYQSTGDIRPMIELIIREYKYSG